MQLGLCNLQDADGLGHFSEHVDFANHEPELRNILSTK